jgi:hypothetical protein
VEEQQSVSPPWQRARSHSTRCSTIPDFQKHYSDSPPPIRLTSPPATFSYSPTGNYGWKGVVLRWLRRSMQNRKRLSTHFRTFRDAWNYGITLGSLYTCPRGPLRRRRWKLGITVRILFTIKFPEGIPLSFG